MNEWLRNKNILTFCLWKLCQNKGIVFKRFGWFNLSEFLFQTDPPLETLETEFTKIFKDSIDFFAGLKLIQREGSSAVEDIDKKTNFFRKKDLIK